MTQENQVFVANVVVTDLTWETVALNVINWLACAIVKISAIVKIRKYRRLHEGHHFILMAMVVHNTPGRNMFCFIRDCACFFHDKWLEGHLSLSFFIQFFK